MYVCPSVRSRGSASDAATVQHAAPMRLPALRGGHLQFNSSAITIQVTHPLTHPLTLLPPSAGFRFYVQHTSERSETLPGTSDSAARNFQDDSEGIRFRSDSRN